MSRDNSVAGTLSSDSSLNPDTKAGGRIKGPAQAPVTLTEFGDFQCPSCGYYHPIVKEVLQRHPEVKFQFHHFPLVQIHANAMAASVAAEAAGQQGKFWEMYDLLFTTQPQWAKSPNPEAAFLAMALQLGLNSNQFQQDLRSPSVRDRVLADVTRGTAANVEGTPTFFINGQRVEGSPGADDLSRLIESRLNPAK
jgi:protein-disulfide isomerase